MPQPQVVQAAYTTLIVGQASVTFGFSNPPAAGNLLFLMGYGQAAVNLGSVTSPAGWTTDVGLLGFGSGDPFDAWGYAHKTAGVSEPASISVTRTGNINDYYHLSLYEISNVTSWSSYYANSAATAAALVINNFPTSPGQNILTINGVAIAASGVPGIANAKGFTFDQTFLNTNHSGYDYWGRTTDGVSAPPTFIAGGGNAGITQFQFIGTANTQPNVCSSVS